MVRAYIILAIFLVVPVFLMPENYGEDHDRQAVLNMLPGAPMAGMTPLAEIQYREATR